MPRLRLGVVLLVPPPIDREIDVLRKATGDRNLGRVPPHMTLVPPVNVRENRLADALAVLRAAAARTRPFQVSFGPPATFLPNSPVLYLPVSDGTPAVTGLRDLVFREPLARALTWPYVPHVTLADEIPPERIEAARSALAPYRVAMTFERVHLLREGPGRVWAPFADASFESPAVVGRGGVEVELSVSTVLDPEARAVVEAGWREYDRAELGLTCGAVAVAVTARREGDVAGVAQGRLQAGLAWLSELVVVPEHRSLGIGSRLLAAFESAAAGRGCPRLAAKAVVGSSGERFLRHRGWVEEARLSEWSGGRELVLLRREA